MVSNNRKYKKLDFLDVMTQLSSVKVSVIHYFLIRRERIPQIELINIYTQRSFVWTSYLHICTFKFVKVDKTSITTYNNNFKAIPL